MLPPRDPRFTAHLDHCATSAYAFMCWAIILMSRWAPPHLVAGPSLLVRLAKSTTHSGPSTLSATRGIASLTRFRAGLRGCALPLLDLLESRPEASPLQVPGLKLPCLQVAYREPRLEMSHPLLNTFDFLRGHWRQILLEILGRHAALPLD